MIIVDIEASGTDPSVHSILSIGAVDFSDPRIQLYEECKLWDGAHTDPEALNVNGFTEENITELMKQTEAQALERFIGWAMERPDHTIAGINPVFDIGFIKAAARRAHVDYPFADRSIDLHSLVYAEYLKTGKTVPLSNRRTDINSDAIMAFVGLPAEPHPHNALNGALWEAEALHRLIYKQPLLDQFKKYPLP